MVAFDYDLRAEGGIIPPTPASCGFEIAPALAAFAAGIGEARPEERRVGICEARLVPTPTSV
jgi:hypothetical protein